MPWWLLPAILVATFILRRLLIKQPDRPDQRPLEFPVVEEGRGIPIVFGTQELAPQITWFGEIVHDGDPGPWYGKVHFVLCWGPLDELIEINFEERSLRGGADFITPALPRARGTDDMTQFVTSAELEDSRATGPLQLFWGTAGHPVSQLLVDHWSADKTPNYFGLVHGTFGISNSQTGLTVGFTNLRNYMWHAGSPYPSAVAFVVRRCPNPPALALSAGQVNLAGDANPVAAAYEIVTDQTNAAGIPTARIDTAQWRQSAITVATEGMGLSFTLSEGDAGQALEDILSHVGAVLRVDPRTNLVQFKLIRPDYDVGLLAEVSPENADELRVSMSYWTETINEYQVRYREFVDTDDRRGFVDASVTAHNQANYAASERATKRTQQFGMCTKAALASLFCQRELRATSVPLHKASFLMNREGFDLGKGDAFKLLWPPFGIGQLVMRVTNIDYGHPDARRLQVDAVADVFGTTAAVFVDPPPTGWTTPTVDTSLPVGS